MNYEQFKSELTELLQEKLGSEIEVINTAISKVNGERDALTFKTNADCEAMPVIYLADQYELLGSGHSMDDIIERIENILEEAKANKPLISMINEDFIRENTFCSLINIEENQELLKKVPYEKFADDLAIIARCRINEQGSFVVNNNIAEQFHFTDTEVMEIAHKNTNSKEKIKFEGMFKTVTEMQGFSVDLPDPDNEDLFVLSNEMMTDGAAVITNTELLKDIKNQLGEDFYIIPSSRHEVLIVRESSAPAPQELLKLVQNVNKTELKHEDLLSNALYCSNGRKVQMINENKLIKDEQILKEVTPERIKSVSILPGVLRISERIAYSTLNNIKQSINEAMTPTM